MRIQGSEAYRGSWADAGIDQSVLVVSEAGGEAVCVGREGRLRQTSEALLLSCA